MGFAEKVYDVVPIFIQNYLISFAGMLCNRNRYGRVYYEHREFLKKFDTYSLEEQKKYCFSELKKFIEFAAEKSPFYRDLYKGIDVKTIRSFSDLKMLPIVDKEMLRKNLTSIFTVEPKDAVEWHTGGTTGKSLCVRATREDFMKRMAILDHFKSRVGFENRQMKRATFNGKHIIPPHQKSKVFWRYNSACRQMIYSSFHLTEENMDAYVKSINKFKPDAIDGFFTSICDVANYMERKGLKPEFQAKAIFPTSENLSAEGRALLERVFGCKVYNQYASSEGAPFVTDCTAQRLHMNLESGYIENLEGSDEILVTSFSTHGTPLIRYRIGDRMCLAENDGKCPCGRPGLLVKSIQGRMLDFLYTAEGARINGGNVANLFKNAPNTVIRAQLRQTEMKKVTMLLEIDPANRPDNFMELIRSEFAHKFGKNTELEIKIVDEIPRESSGKFKMIVNEVDSPK